MFVPIHDNTPLQVIRVQYVTFGLIAVNVALFLLTGAVADEVTLASTAANYGIVPSEVLRVDAAQGSVPEPLTFLTYQFLHAGWLHLLSNMLFLWVFADNVEDAYGHAGFLMFYVLVGAAGGLAHVLMQPGSAAPLIGASGAVSGVLAAYAILFPRARVWILLFMRIPVPLPAIWVLGGWFALQLASLFWSRPEDGIEVAWWAHIGGFVAGLGLTFLLRGRLQVRTTE
jgi:membrane associated rhomboid family serine protease